MEFFERAHVSKRSLPKKDSKSEEMVKKQLKQMLYGYKQSDNELIMSSGNAYNDIAEVHKVFDDSASVSGFSDLDLTKSDDEDEIALVVASEACVDEVSSSSDANLTNSNSLEQSDDLNALDTDQDQIDHSGDYLEPISEGDEDVDSLSEDIELSECSSTSGDSFLEFVSTTQSVSTDSTDSDSDFDADGSLASKIMENLSKKQHNNPQSNKRKLDDVPNPAAKKENKQKKNKKKSANKNVNNIEIEMLSINDNERDIEKLMDTNTQDSVSTNSSSPFISIMASEMSDQSLNDILGDYRHPTVKNLPCEKQNIVPSITNTSIFSTDENMQVEDVDSLIPEIGEDPVIEDIEIELNATTDNEIQSNIESNMTSESIETNNEPKKKNSANPIKVYYADSHCIFVMRHPAKLYVNGKVKIKPLGGKVEVFGHILTKEINLYSPNNSFAHCIQTLEADNVYYGLFGRLTALGLTVSETEEIVTSLGEFDGVIAMSALNDAKMDFVDRHFCSDVFTKLKIDSNAHRLVKPSDILGSNIYLNKPLRSFVDYFDWDEGLSYGMKESSRGIVCGGKGLGKSSFVRCYVNRVLVNGPVLVIDLDPGQSEFTVAGNISAIVVTTPLLGPNFTHLRTPDISYNLGMISVMDNISRFASAVAKLIEQCHAKYYAMPWIINTMGMTNNMGLKFIVLTILHAQPTFLVQIDSKVVKKRFECSLEPQAIRIVYENCKYDRLFRKISFPEDLDYKFMITSYVEGSFKQDTSLSPRDERYLNFLAYFGELKVTRKGEDFLGIVPYEVSLSDINVVTNVKVAREAVLKVINGKIVALCQLNTTDKGKVFTLQDNAPLCYGHGLIRGVDFEKGLVYLVTPVTAARLCAVNALVYSDWAPELQGTESLLPAGLPVPYRGAVQHNNKQHLLTPRRRFNPLQLLKMSRSA